MNKMPDARKIELLNKKTYKIADGTLCMDDSYGVPSYFFRSKDDEVLTGPVSSIIVVEHEVAEEEEEEKKEKK